MRLLPVLLLFIVSLGTAGTSQAGDAKAGKTKAAQCAVCHGTDGLSKMVEAPNLAGQPTAYLEEQLRNYRSGKRSHEIMGVIAKALNDKDIEDLAAWFSGIQIEVTLPK